MGDQLDLIELRAYTESKGKSALKCVKMTPEELVTKLKYFTQTRYPTGLIMLYNSEFWGKY